MRRRSDLRHHQQPNTSPSLDWFLAITAIFFISIVACVVMFFLGMRFK